MSMFCCEISYIHDIPLSVSHEHKQIVFVLQGTCAVKRFSSLNEFREGDVFFINQNEVYSIHSDEGCLVEWIEVDLGCLSRDDKTDRYLLNLCDSIGSLDQEKEMAEVYRDCVFLKNLLHLGLKENQENCFQEICEALMSDYHVYHQAMYFSEEQMHWVLQVLKMIQENLYQKMSLQKMAEVLKMQKSNLATQFKLLTQKTILEYANQQRLKKAEELLLFTDLNHLEIIRQCGFSDSKYFYRYFMDEFQMTPAAWKEKMKMMQNRCVEAVPHEKAERELRNMLNQLSGLKTETDLYRTYLRVKELKRMGFFNSHVVMEADLLHPDNMIEADGTKVNAWYGFDLLMSEIGKESMTVNLKIHIDSSVSKDQIDELFVLLNRSVLKIPVKQRKGWRFVLEFEDVSQMRRINQIKKRLDHDFGIPECEMRYIRH